MPRKTKIQKLEEVFGWLNETFPVRRRSSFKLDLIDKDFQGYVLYDDEEIEVVIDKKAPFYVACDTMLHEWTHVKSRRAGHGIVFIEWQHRIDEAFWKWRKTIESKI